MLSVFEECEEIIFQEYLEFAVLCHFDGRCAWLIGDESDLTEKCSCFIVGDYFSADDDIELSLNDIVGTTIGWLADSDYFFSFLPVLSLAHEKEVGHLCLIEAIEDIELFDV